MNLVAYGTPERYAGMRVGRSAASGGGGAGSTFITDQAEGDESVATSSTTGAGSVTVEYGADIT